MSGNAKSTQCGRQHPLVPLVSAIGLLLIVIGPAKADFVFGEPENLGAEINTAQHEYGSLGLSDDGLSFAFLRKTPGVDDWSPWLAVRTAIDAPWQTPVRQDSGKMETALRSPDIRVCFTEHIGPDGLEAYFPDDRDGGYGGLDIWMLSRETPDEDWDTPVNLGPVVNSAHDDWWAVLSPDGLELYLCDDDSSPRPGGSGSVDIWVARRESLESPWTEPVNLGPNVNSDGWDSAPYLSPDGLVLLFDSDRQSGLGSWDLYMSRRASLSEPWGRAVSLGSAVNTSRYEESPQLSVDGSTLSWGSIRSGGYGNIDMWQASILPIVDFNGDGQADGLDVLVMTDCWERSEALCDIGPMPWGDGVVDLEDLIVLAEYIDQDVFDPTLVAHWPFDESEGIGAAEVVGQKSGWVMNGGVWQPEGGMVGGALELDGLDDFVIVDHDLDLGGGAFSVLLWARGGAPGQVIISQVESADWLLAGPSDGTLMTAISRGASRPPSPPLSSDCVITDGQWHRIAFVYDGADRILYADGIEVARDTQDCPEEASQGLYFGCGNERQDGTFWSGLIDDVRIYNRVVRP